MDFDAWTNRSVDRDRQKRLMFGYSFGVLSVGALLTALTMTSQAQEPPPKEERILDVVLAEEPEPEPEPEPEVEEPEPEPEPEPVAPQPQPAGPVLPEMTAPEDIPDDAPEEKEPDASNPYATDQYAYGNFTRGKAKPSKKKVVVKAEPKLEPKKVARPTGPVRVTADTVPPKVLSAGRSSYPTAAKAAGIQGRVVVRFVVDTQGNPTQVRAVRGPESLRAACVNAVKGTKYSPAKDKKTGRVISVHKNKVCNFKLKT